MSAGPSSLGERDAKALADIVAFGALAEELVARGKAVYDADVLLQLSAEAILHRIGEAVSRLSDALIQEHPEIRFRAMKGARNLVAHKYQVVDPEILWKTVAEALPEDLGRVRELLGR